MSRADKDAVAEEEPVYTDERIWRWINYELDRSPPGSPKRNPRRVLFRLAVNMRDEYEALLRHERTKRRTSRDQSSS